MIPDSLLTRAWDEVKADWPTGEKVKFNQAGCPSSDELVTKQSISFPQTDCLESQTAERTLDEN